VRFTPPIGAAPTFSADGKSIAYVQSGIDFSTTAVRVRTSSGADFEVTRFTGDMEYIEKLSWSPDGTQLAVGLISRDSSGDNRSYIYRVGLDGSPPVVLVSGSPDDPGGFMPEHPDWAPSDDRIVYTLGSDLFLVDASTGAETQLTHECNYDEDPVYCGPDLDITSLSYPDWSPDGTEIVVDVLYQPDEGPHEVYVGRLAVGSEEPTKVIDIAKPDESWTSAQAIWSPDGTMLALHLADAVDRNDVDTYVLALSGGTPERVAEFGLQDWQPCPNGACPVFRGPEKRSTTISMDFSLGKRLRVDGQVRPNRAGATVRVDLKIRRSGKWRPVATKHPPLSASSRYVVKFTRPSARKCQLIATYAGDASYKPSSTADAFRC